jgi:mannose-1-phosphate guanylyltransferase
VLEVKGDDIVEFREKPVLEDKLVSAGMYVFNRAISQYLPQTGSMEKQTFSVLAKKKLLKAFRLNENERWLTVNSIKDLSVAEKEFITIRGI